ncbi:MAG TPA: Ku protein [Symbiobacteriaceae bacterium]
MWKGSISFGLVTIPVKLYTATEDKDLSFHLLHDECRTRVQYKKWCPNCDREVAGDEIVRGYELDRGRYVILTDEDFESIPLVSARTLEIVDFVRLDQIDPVYFDRTYYLEPGEGGAKAYALLRRAMAETGRIAIARVVIRAKESLAAIRVFENGVLALETMHFPEEIRSTAGLTGIAQPELQPQELEMAKGLVASLAGDFRPERFQNQYRDALLSIIEAKAAGAEIEPAPAPERGKVVDLMDALRASIRLAEQARGQAPAVEATAGVPAPGVSGVAAAGGAVPGLPGVPAVPGVRAVPGMPASAAVPGVAIPRVAVPGVAIPGLAGPGGGPHPGGPHPGGPHPGGPQ